MRKQKKRALLRARFCQLEVRFLKFPRLFRGTSRCAKAQNGVQLFVFVKG